MKSLRNLNFKKNRKNIVEALVSGHPRGVKEVSITGVVRFRESKNTEFVWEMKKTGFRDSGRLRKCPLGQLPTTQHTEQ